MKIADTSFTGFAIPLWASNLWVAGRDVPVTLFHPVMVTTGIVKIPAGSDTGILGHAHNFS